VNRAAVEVAAPQLLDVARSRVLVVDDDLPSVQLVQCLLSRSGYRSVSAVADARQLLGQYEQLAPELIVLELHLPGVDGYSALAELRSRATPADLPILVLSADPTREAAHRALELGANDLLSKPLDATELVLRVGNLLQTRDLHVRLQGRQRWVEASGRLAAELLAGACPDPLRRVSELALRAAGADTAVVALPGVSRERAAREVTAHVWVGDESGATAAAVADAFSSHALNTETARLVDDLAVAAGRDPRDPATGPAMLVPLADHERVIGAVLLCRRRGRPGFTEAELDLACGFAGQAVLAVEFAQARADQERIALLADRHRIARDLHDQVIQRLFATGLRLQQLAERIGPGPVASRLDAHVNELDNTISELRSTIFGLRQETATGPGRLSFALRDLVAELTEVLGFKPSTRFEEPLDVVPDDVAVDLVAAAREAVTNVARHAKAEHAEVSVTLPGSEVVLEVIDDGVGIGDAVRRSGLTNLGERAMRHGGSFIADPMPSGGTRLIWTASLGRDQSSRCGSFLDGHDRHGSVDEELIRAGVATGESLGRRPLNAHRDVQLPMRTLQPDD
jgi:signal transduction histidine kinase